MILLSSIIEEFEGRYFEQYKNSILPSHEKALRVMKQCRTDQSPQMLAQCTGDACSHFAYIPHSCGHRSCPHCQSHESQQWIEKQLNKQLPVQYYLLTFTLPKEFRDLVWKNQKSIYSLLFQCVKEVLQRFSKNDKELKGVPGMTMILHTHSRRLDYHPHIHVVMPGACIDKKTKSWNVKKGKYIFNHKALAKVFRATILKGISEKKLQLPTYYPKKWVVDCKNVGNGDKAFIYLGKYLYKGVIQEKDILECKDGSVTFGYIDSKTKKYQRRTVKGEYFLYLLMQHVLPKGFRRTRDYGFLHACSKQLIKLLQYLLDFSPSRVLKELTKRTGILCKCCGAQMEIIQRMIPSTAFMKKGSIIYDEEGR